MALGLPKPDRRKFAEIIHNVAEGTSEQCIFLCLHQIYSQELKIEIKDKRKLTDINKHVNGNILQCLQVAVEASWENYLFHR